jgi:hypothetical protein
MALDSIRLEWTYAFVRAWVVGVELALLSIVLFGGVALGFLREPSRGKPGTSWSETGKAALIIRTVIAIVIVLTILRVFLD